MEIDIEKIEELIKYIPIINAPDFNPLNEDEPVQGLDVIYSLKAHKSFKQLFMNICSILITIGIIKNIIH